MRYKYDKQVLDAIRAEMARHRVTQQELAARFGFSQQAISNRLNGITPLTAEEIRIIADEIGCHVEALEGNSHVV
jgi:transcriptional regulator with XRE-family HTH domain